jgi:integrase
MSLYLNDCIKEIYQEIRMGNKKLTLEEVKSILKIEVDKSVLHIQHTETGTGTTESQVLHSLQHITKEETQFKRTLEDERKKIEGKVDREMSKILKSNGFKIDKKSLEFKTLRKRVIELKLLRYKYKKDYVSGKNTDLNKFLNECDMKFNLGVSFENTLTTELELQEKLQQSESILGSRILRNDDEVVEVEETYLISNLIDEYLEETKRQKDLREKTIVEYRSVLEMMVEIIGDFPINELSQKHGRLFSSSIEKLPPRRKFDGRYKNKSIKEIIKMDVKLTMDTRTINTLIQRCSTWLNWVIKKGYYEDRNVFHGKSISSKKGKSVITRQPFNEKQLKLIFGKNYLDRSLNSPSHCKFVFYWVGILGLFHGTRLQETTQLHINDIYPLRKIWVIDINDKTKDKKLKTLHSNRIIPLHQTLIDLGFLDYIRILEQNGKERLFHELTLGRDGYTKNPSKFFNDYLRELGIKSPTKKYDFHSLRHTCNNSLIQNDVFEEYRNDYLGWGQTGMSKNVYGKPFEPPILQKRCSKKISYKIKWNDLTVDWKLVLG